MNGQSCDTCGDDQCTCIDGTCGPYATSCDSSQGYICSGCVAGCECSDGCYCSDRDICETVPCPDCVISDDGMTMVCPSGDSCQSVTKRDLGGGIFNSSQHSHARISNPRRDAKIKKDVVFSRSEIKAERDLSGRLQSRARQELEGHPLRLRNIWGMMDKRDGIEVLLPGVPTPIRDAWNYLLWTSPLVVRRTSSSVVSTTLAATFTLDVFPGGSTSYPTLTSTPPLAIEPTTPACIPATIIRPTGLVKREDGQSVIGVKPYVSRDSTTVTVGIRDNYLLMTSNIPTITQGLPTITGGADSAHVSNAVVGLTTMTMEIQSIGDNGVRATQSVVVVRPDTGTINSGDNAALIDYSSGGSRVISGSDSNSLGLDPDSGSGSNSGSDGNDSGSGGSDETTEDSKLAKLSGTERIVNLPFTMGSYVAALYLPALMAVVIKILFETMVASIKMMEPFERLHRAQGATAEDSVCSQYLSSSLSADVFHSIWHGRSIPLWTLIIYISIAVGAPLAAASMTVRPMDECIKDGAKRLCDPAWIVDLNFIRIMEALLVLCLVLTIVLAWDSWYYNAGVPTNPSSISAMAVLLNYEPLRHDLQTIEPDASEEETFKALEDYHFWLTPHNPSRTQMRYGIVHSPERDGSNEPAAARTGFLGKMFVNLETRYKALVPGVHPQHMNRVGDYVHIFITAALFVLLIVYRADTKTDAFNRFFASNKIWPKLIILSLAAIIDMQWKNLEREVRITEPYRRLYYGNARPENTILCDLNGTCWSNAPVLFTRLFKYKHMWFEFLVGITAVLSDVNIIAISGVLMTAATTEDAYAFSSLTALTVMSWMSTVLLVTVFWWRRTAPVRDMPRVPETIAVVLSYICTSRMAADFAAMGMENLTQRERDEVIIAKNRRYRFAKMMGEDGKERWCVDYDESADGGDGREDRDSWVREKMERPAAVRLSTGSPSIPTRSSSSSASTRSSLLG